MAERGRESEKKERDVRGERRDRPQKGDELLVKWLHFSSRACRLLVLAPDSASHRVITAQTWKEPSLKTTPRSQGGVTSRPSFNFKVGLNHLRCKESNLRLI